LRNPKRAIDNGQSRYTGNIENHTGRRPNKTKNTTQKTKTNERHGTILFIKGNIRDFVHGILIPFTVFIS
jgi:hypothetical protein